MADLQNAVEALAARLGCAVLVEDSRHHPLWWSAQGEVDAVRMGSILQREAPPLAAAMVARLGIARAEQPVRTPALPEADMAERWCVPARESGMLYGYLWVLDPHRKVSENDVAAALPVAGLAARTLARLQPTADERERRRAVLLSRLQAGSNPDAARALVDLEDLSTDAVVVVNYPRAKGGWALPDGMTAHVDPSPGGGHTSGPPVPLEQLGVAVWRAVVTRRALRAGARLARPTWDALGSWHLVVNAPVDLSPGLVHPGADLLRSQRRDDLLVTARCVLDNAGDVTASADELHIHRSTLYYRLDRIEALTSVNLRHAAGRDDLHLALHLAAYRDA